MSYCMRDGNASENRHRMKGFDLFKLLLIANKEGSGKSE